MSTVLPHTALTVSASDSGGGGGIQGDLKTFAAFGVYGLSVVTSVIAQNTQEVAAIAEVPDEVVIAQLDTVLPDIGAESIKTGILSSAAIVGNVVDRIEAWGFRHLVVNPQMISASGAPLLHPDALEPLKTELLPLATVLVATVQEAEVLVGRQIATPAHAQQATRALHSMGPSLVMMLGYPDGDESAVLVSEGRDVDTQPARGVDYTTGYGTGSTLSAALTALLAKGADPRAAVSDAMDYVARCVASSWSLGEGMPLLAHFATQSG